MSLIGTKDEYKRAITSAPEDQDMGFMENLATLIAAKHPEYEDAMGTPDKIMQFFAQVGNLLTAEQITQIRATLAEPSDTPLEESICLSDDEVKQWKKGREDALVNAGLDPSIAKDFIDRQDERRKSDLADIAEIMAKGPENMIADALNSALGDGGGGGDSTNPDCAVTKAGAVQLDKIDQLQDAVKKATEGMFKRLEKAFIDDVILWRWPMDPRSWFDTPGILSIILGDFQNYTMNFQGHECYQFY